MDRSSRPAPTERSASWTKKDHASKDFGATSTRTAEPTVATAVGPKKSQPPAWRSVPRCFLSSLSQQPPKQGTTSAS